MNDEDAELLGAVDAGSQPLTFVVSGPEPADRQEHALPRTFAVIGRGQTCDVRLKSEEVSFRHAYLQTIGKKLFCIDLASRTGLRWHNDVRTSGWLHTDRTVRIGPYTIAVPSDPVALSSEAAEASNPLEQFREHPASLPKVRLEFLDRSRRHPSWMIDRRITLAGRHAQCKLRLDGKNVSGVHCSLLLTSQGLWVIDLLGKGGTRVDEKQDRCARVADGQRIEIGPYRIRVHYEGELLTTGEKIPPTGGPHSQPAAAAVPVAGPVQPIFSEVSDSVGFESLLKVRRAQEAMIVSPHVEGGAFRYAQLRTACNAVRRLLDEPDVRCLVIDLERLNYFGAEFVGVLITLARNVTNSGGKVAFCSAGKELQEVLQNMNLFGLWPHFESVDAALEALRRGSA